MKNNTIKLILFLIGFFTLTACTDTTHKKEQLLQAETLINTHPDSALSVLQSIDSPEKMSKKDYATWCLLKTKADDKNYIHHTSDSLINIAVDYFEKTEDKERKAEAWYYKGVVFSDLNDVLQAQTYYLNAVEAIEDSKNYALKGRIYSNLGTLYTYQDLYPQALEFQKKALYSFNQLKDSYSLGLAFRNIARIYSVEEKHDSAIFFYSQALDLIPQFRSFSILIELTGSYIKSDNFEKSLDLVHRASSLVKTSNDSCVLSLAYGELYLKLDKLDSALFYLSKSIISPNLYTVASAYSFLADLEKKRNNPMQYMVYQDKYALLKDSIDKITKMETLTKYQSLYNYQQVEKKKEFYRQESAHKTILFYRFAIIVTFVILILVFAFFYIYILQKKRAWLKDQSLRAKESEYRNSTLYWKEKEKTMLRIKDELANRLESKNNELKLKEEEKENICKQMEALSSLAYKSSNILKLLENNNIEKEIALFRNSDEYTAISIEWKKINEEEWAKIIENIDNLLFFDFSHRLKALYPSISKSELQICYLVKLEIPIKRIATLLCVTSQSISNSRKRLYTKLTGKKGGSSDFDSFIKDF